MRVLILGGSGMLGHKLWQTFAPRFDAYVTFRGEASAYNSTGLFELPRTISNVSAQNFDFVARAFSDIQPEAVVNCIGIVKQDVSAKDPLKSIEVNSLFPHRLAELARARGARLLHLSTDCVFSGRAGNYTESSISDAEDLYGRTKFLGEVAGDNCLTIRTSMIGREIVGSHGLLEWFLSQKDKRVSGFTRAIFTGLTTLALAEIIADVLIRFPDLTGVRHIAADPISKFDLLSLIQKQYGLRIDIEPDSSFVCDRSLDGSRFYAETGIRAPSWPVMIAAMRDDATPYEAIRAQGSR